MKQLEAEKISTVTESTAVEETPGDKEITIAKEGPVVQDTPPFDIISDLKEMPVSEEIPAAEASPADKEIPPAQESPSAGEEPAIIDTPEGQISEKISIAPLAMLMKTMWDIDSTGDEPAEADTEKPKYSKEKLELRQKTKRLKDESSIHVEEIMPVHAEPEENQFSEQELKIAEMRRQKRKKLADEPTKQLKSLGEGLEGLLLQSVWGDSEEQVTFTAPTVVEVSQETDLTDHPQKDSSEEREPSSKPYEVTFPPDQESLTKEASTTESRDSSAERDPTSGFEETITTGAEYVGVEIVELTEEQKQSIRESSVEKYPTDETFISDDKQPVVSAEPTKSRDSSEERDVMKDASVPEIVQRDSSEEREPVSSTQYGVTFPEEGSREPVVIDSRDSSAERDPTTGFEEPLTSGAEYTGVAITELPEEGKQAIRESSIDKYPTEEPFISDDMEPPEVMAPTRSRDSSEERDPTSEEHVHKEEKERDSSEEREPVSKPYEVIFPADEERVSEASSIKSRDSSAERDPTTGFEEPVTTGTEYIGTEIVEFTEEQKRSIRESSVEKYPTDEHFISEDKEPSIIAERTNSRDSSAERDPIPAEDSLAIQGVRDRDSSEEREPSTKPYEFTSTDHKDLSENQIAESRDSSAERDPTSGFQEAIITGSEYTGSVIEITEEEKQSIRETSVEKYPTDEQFITDDKKPTTGVMSTKSRDSSEERDPTSPEEELKSHEERDSSEEREPVLKPYDITDIACTMDQEPDGDLNITDSRDSSAERDPTRGFDEPVTTGEEYEGIGKVELTEEEKQAIRESSVEKYPTDELFISDDKEPIDDIEQPSKSRDSSVERDPIPEEEKTIHSEDRDSSEEREPLVKAYDVPIQPEHIMQTEEREMTESRDSSAERDPASCFEPPVTTGPEYAGVEVADLTEEQKQSIRESSVEKYPTDESFISDDKKAGTDEKLSKSRDSSEERDPTDTATINGLSRNAALDESKGKPEAPESGKRSIQFFSLHELLLKLIHYCLGY